MKLKISIITVNLNNRDGLQKTLESTRCQTYPYFEQLVIDGGSTDGSVEFLTEVGGMLSYWRSEPDRGIYHAMNKGIVRAGGDYLLFLNSGDWLNGEDVLARLVDSLEPEIDIIYADMVLHRPAGGEQFVKHYPDRLEPEYFFSSSLPHQAALIRKSLFDEIGLYDERMRICADWAFFFLAKFRHGKHFRHLSFPFSHFPLDGISCLQNDAKKVERGDFFGREFPEYLRGYKALENKESARKGISFRAVLAKIVRKVFRSR